MDITVTQLDPVTVLAVTGSLDGLTADAFTQGMGLHLQAGRYKLITDFAGVDYTSSAGLRSLLTTVKHARQAGGDMRMCSVKPLVMRVLSMSGFHSFIKIYDDLPAALASFDPIG
jgi:anti-sigma B factor antagonist